MLGSAYQEEIDRLFQSLGWNYWSPLSIMGRLSEEVGEVAREVNHRYGDKKKRSSEAAGDIEEEVGDVLYTLICFANGYGYCFDRALQASSRASMVYPTLNPLAILARLSARAGALCELVEQWYDGDPCSYPDPDVRIEQVLGDVLRIAQVLVVQVGGSCDGALHKSIAKVAVRDKDRFPEGK